MGEELKNLTGGFGKLYTAPTDEALPEIDDLSPPAITVDPAGNWSPVGFTLEAHELRYSPEFEDENVNEREMPVNVVKMSEDPRFFVRFKERDMAHLNLAIAASVLESIDAAANQTGQLNLTIGGGQAAIKSLLYVFDNEEGGSGLIHIPRAVAVGDVTFPFAKIPDPYDVEFRALSSEIEGDEEIAVFIYNILEPATE